MEDLHSALIDELKNNRELLEQYKEIGPAGQFGYIMISKDIDEGEKALKSMDVVDMLKAYNKLKNNS